MKKKGLIDDGRIEKKFNIKRDFAESPFFKNVKIWKNEQIENPERKQKTVDYLKDNLELKFDLESLGIREQEIDFDKEDSDTERLNINDVNKKTITKAIKDLKTYL